MRLLGRRARQQQAPAPDPRTEAERRVAAIAERDARLVAQLERERAMHRQGLHPVYNEWPIVLPPLPHLDPRVYEDLARGDRLFWHGIATIDHYRNGLAYDRHPEQPPDPA